ncbi:MAG: hypothetical protein HOO99_04130 [Hyphomicrobiaceae bacterium]|nr:hypothetical protein [Hyphomicrobiaceae bacterium]
MNRQAQTTADRYIGRDGSPVETVPRSRELTRAAVRAAQKVLAASFGGGESPISDAEMHKVLKAAISASPELFEKV